ncbi:MAG: response regulator transcription factor [Campylobacterales bacterium]|nr:response regulator transcription factor [Campylobacterales bacterium]
MTNVLIIDEEIYLAQKVSLRLQEDGYNCTSVSNIKEIHFETPYDTILLSTNLSSDDVHKIIKHYNEATIILLVSYVNDVTVTKPLKDGADDYIVKPFIMNELIRKINHFEEFKLLKSQNKNMQNYLEFAFNNVEYQEKIPTSLPFVIETNDQKLADKIVFDVARKLNKTIKFISLEHHTKIEPEDFVHELLYIYDFHFAKKTSKDIILNTIKDFDAIICSLEEIDQDQYPVVHVRSSNKLSNVESIMAINDYVKMMVLNFQNKYPDTELSKKLGISRKSLWEKRKKFGIEKGK